MKLIKKVLLVVLTMSTLVSVFGQAREPSASRGFQATSKTTWIMDDFDDHAQSTTVNIYNGGRHNIVWDIVGSQYITQTDEKPYPMQAYVPGVPASMIREYKREPEAMRIFAIRAAFNSKGINTLTLTPIDENNTIFVDADGNPLPGVYFPEPIYKIGVYALGLLRDYEVIANFSAGDGTQFKVSLGNLNYTGWKILAADIPIDKYINEEMFINDRYLIRFKGFTIKTSPFERVDDFVIYFDQLFYTQAAVNEKYYDGYELSLPDYKFNADGTTHIEWKEGAQGQQNSSNAQGSEQ